MDQSYWRAKRLQHLASRALKTSNRFSSASAAANHHFRRYLKLLLLATEAWRKVDAHPIEREAA